MIIKKNNREKFGIPYQGSKTAVISEIAMCIPGADNFYDLFGGGFSASHYMMARRKRSFKQFHYNEIIPGMCELISDAINGKFNYKVFTPEWISRERFFAEKESNAYIKIIWSFGNNGNNYLFGKDIEEQKRQQHMAVVYDDFYPDFIKIYNFNKWPKGLTITGKRLFLKEVARRVLRGRCDLEQLERLEQLQQLEQIKRLQQLKRLEQLDVLQLTNLDYREVLIKPKSVIYCDIPYKGTGDYGGEFSHDDFFEWAHKQKTPVFISEYNIADDRFYLLKKIKHRSTFGPGKNTEVCEKLYCNASAKELLDRLSSGVVTKTRRAVKK